MSSGKSYWTKRRRIQERVNEHMRYSLHEVGPTGGSSVSGSLISPDSNSHQGDQYETVCQSLASDLAETDSDDQSCAASTATFREISPGAQSALSVDEDIHLFEGYVSAATDSESDDGSDFGLHAGEIEHDKESFLQNQLGVWATEFNITHRALSCLLKILKDFHPHLPKDPRTLLGTKRHLDVQAVGGGSYHHIGIASSLATAVSSMDLSVYTDSCMSISIQVNIDGLPLFNSSRTQLWPILGRVVAPFKSHPFVIGVFCGQGKPDSPQEFLQHFVAEMQMIERNGVNLDGFQHPLRLQLECFVCDTPARCFIKQVKGHSGYHGCDHCSQEGRWSGKMTFPDVGAPLRTDDGFRNRDDRDHHIGVSPLLGLRLGMVTQFPPDYMHLVCLGVMRRFLWIWFKSPVSRNLRIGAQAASRISHHLDSFRDCLPTEFPRKCRSLDEMERWKATELRQFLLYSGPVVLKDAMHEHLYRHFLLLSVAIYCLVSPLFCVSHCELAGQLLRDFVLQAAQFYGRDVLVYNVHGLVHLAAAVGKYGALDNFSAFPFENFLGRMKRLVRSPNLPLQQVVRRLSEKRVPPPTSAEKGTLKKPHHSGPLPPMYRDCAQFKEISFPDLLISTASSDNCVRVNGACGLVRNILYSEGSGTSIVYERFSQLSPFFGCPVNSSDLGICVADSLSGFLEVAPLDRFQWKFVKMPYDHKFVLVPLPHLF